MISSIGSNYGQYQMNGMGGPRGGQRPDASKMAEDLFSKLDTKGQGYIEKSDLESAFAGIGSTDTSSTSSGVDEVFSKLDSDSDGKVTKDELSSALQSLSKQLDAQFDNMRMNGKGGPGGAGGMPPPPPPPQGAEGEDQGLTQDQLTSMASDISSTDSSRAELMKNLAANFDQADSDGNGKVTREEAMAYQQSQSSDSASYSSTTTSSSSSSNNDATVMMRIMQLIHAYGGAGKDTSNSVLTTSA